MIALYITAGFTLILTSELSEAKQLHVYAGPQQQLDWNRAFGFCQSKGKNLVTTLDWTEHYEMGNAIHECSKKCGRHLTNSWTAANDLDKEWNFEWRGINKRVDLDMGNWQPGNPDHYQNNERCVVAWWPERYRFKPVYLNDRPCGDTNNVICE